MPLKQFFYLLQMYTSIQAYLSMAYKDHTCSNQLISRLFFANQHNVVTDQGGDEQSELSYHKPFLEYYLHLMLLVLHYHNVGLSHHSFEYEHETQVFYRKFVRIGGKLRIIW